MKCSSLATWPFAFALVSASSSPLEAQGFGEPQELTQALPQLFSGHAADLDGDGMVDLLTGGGERLDWFRNTGSGSFQLEDAVSTDASLVLSIDSGDLDGDGDLDVAAAVNVDERIVWFENLGGGQFGPMNVVAQGFRNAKRVDAEDLDGDGDLDLLAIGVIPDKVVWFENQGAGSYGQEQVLLLNTEGSHALSVADLEGDGDLDIAVAESQSDNVGWLENLGGGVFSGLQLLASAENSPHQIYAADLNGNGEQDVLVVSAAFLGLAWYPGLGGGQFGARVSIDTDIRSRVGEPSDLDGDGDLDVTFIGWQDDQLYWLENDGLGGFAPAQLISAMITSAPRSPFSADLDGDGDQDVVTITNFGSQLAWNENNGQGSFGPLQEISSSAAFPRTVLSVDIDMDGDLDALSCSDGDSKVAWYENQGEQGLAGQAVLAQGTNGAAAIAVGDIDGDGAPDVVVCESSPYAVSWRANLGDGQLGPKQVIDPFAGTFLNFAHVADLDGDGWLDIVTVSSSQGRIDWYRSTGFGNFAPREYISLQAEFASFVTTADLDGDGDLDVLGTAKASSPVHRTVWFENLGNGLFTLDEPINDLPKPTVVRAVDLNQDGSLDVITGGDSVVWQELSGSLAFGPQIPIYPEPVRTLDVADVDGDGDIDLVIGIDDQILWLEHLPGTVYAAPQVISSDVDDPNSLALADLDGDGDVDVLGDGGLLNTVFWADNLFDPSVGQVYCSPAIPNSTQQSATLTAVGSTWLPNNTLTVYASALPPNQTCMFLASPNQGFVPGPGGSDGNLCLGSPIGRFNRAGEIQSSGTQGVTSLSVDLSQLPSPGGQVMALMGETWNFQTWYRDVTSGPTSNFTSGLSVDFQ